MLPLIHDFAQLAGNVTQLEASTEQAETRQAQLKAFAEQLKARQAQLEASTEQLKAQQAQLKASTEQLQAQQAQQVAQQAQQAAQTNALLDGLEARQDTFMARAVGMMALLTAKIQTERQEFAQDKARLEAEVKNAQEQAGASAARLQEVAAGMAELEAVLAEEAAAAGVSLPAAQGMLRKLRSSLTASSATAEEESAQDEQEQAPECSE